MSATAGADLLGVQPDYPNISFGGGSSSATIDQTAAPSFDVYAQSPELVLLSGGDINTAFGDPVTILQLNVNNVCDLITGVIGDDVSVSGTFYDPAFNVVKDGVVFTGEIVEVGNAMATATTAVFDFRATVTGGLLLIDGDWPLSSGVPVEAGIQLTLEGTSVPPFTTNNCNILLTSTRAKGIIGPDVSVPPNMMYTNPGTARGLLAQSFRSLAD